MSDIATLGIRIDARQVRDADTALDHLAQTGGRTEQAVDGVNSAFERMQRLALSVGAALGAAEIVKQADAWANLEGQISLVADSQERLAQTTDELYGLAQRTRQGLKETVDLYSKIVRSTESLNKTDTERMRLTETINKALVTSHASTQASSAALLQLGQAFSMGQLRGQELNSVLEETPGLARAIAEGMGKTTGDLKTMAEAGKLTAEAVFNALQRSAGTVDAEFAKLPTTVGQATTQIQNSLLRTIGVFDQSNQLSASFAHGLTVVSENMTLVAGAAATLAAVKVVTTLADWNVRIQQNIAANVARRAAIVASYEAQATETAIASLNATAALRQAETWALGATTATEQAIATSRLVATEAEATIAANAHTAAMERLTIAQRMYSAGSSVAGTALAALGGPLGLIVTVLGVAATAWTWYQQKEEEANRKAGEDTAKSTGEIIDGLDKQIAKLRMRAELMKQAGKDAPIVQQGGDAADRAAETLAQINALKAKGAALDAGDQVALITLTGIYDQLVGKAKELAGVTAGVNAQTNADKVKDWLQKHTEYLDKAGKVAAAIAEARKDLGAAFNSDIESKIRASFDKQDVDKAKSAYQELIASIREKIATNQIEAAVGRDATEAQKEQIKYDQQLAAGKLKLSAAQRASVQAALDALAVTEKQAKAVQVAKDLAKADDESRLAQQEAAAGLAVYAANFGKLSDARDIDMIAVKNQFELQRKLLDLYNQGVTLSQDATDKMRADTAARTANEQAILAQTKALQYADQLRQANQQFSIDYTVDPKAKAAAQLAIDKAMWTSRINLAAEGTEARKRLEDEYAVWLQNQQVKPQLDAQIEMWNSIEQAARDAFIGILSNGKSTFERLRDSLKNSLYALLYEMTVKKWIVQVKAQMSGTDAATGGTGGTGDVFAAVAAGSSNPLIQAVGAASSLYKAITGGVSGLGGSIASGLGSGISSLGQMMGNDAVSAFGKGMQGFGLDGSLGQAAGYGQTAGLIAGKIGNVAAGYTIGSTLNGAISGQYSTGSGLMTTEKIATAVASYFGPQFGALAGAISGLVNRAFGRGPTESQGTTLSGMLALDGSVSGATASKYHQSGGWFRSDKDWTETKALTDAMQAQLTNAFAAIKVASGGFAQTLGVGTEALTTYSKAFDITLTGDATKDQQAVETFFNGVSDEIARKLVPNLDTFSQSGETASATLQRLAGEFAATTTAAQNLGKTAAEFFGSSGIASAAARDRLVQLAGSNENLTSLTASFAQNYLTEAERLAPVSKALDAALGSLGLSTVPATTAQFKALVQSLDPADEASAKLLVSLLQLSDAFYQVHGAVDDAAVLAGKLDAAYTALGRAVDAQKTVLKTAYDATMAQLDAAINRTKTSISQLTTLSNALHDAVGQAAGVSTSRADAQAQIRTALALAKAGGVLPTADSLKDALSAVTADSKNQFSTFEAYQRDRLQTAIDISNLASVTDSQLDTADKQLAVLEATKDAVQAAYDAEIARLDNVLETAQRQIDAIKGVDVSVQSVEQAVAALQALMGGNATAGIVGAYGNALGRAPDAAGLAYFQAQAAAGTSISDITKAIGSSAEAAGKIEQLYEKVFSRTADAAGMQYWQGQLSSGVSLGAIEAAMRASDEARAQLASATTSSVTTATTISGNSTATDAAITQALNRIASYTQRAAVATEDANRNALETTA